MKTLKTTKRGKRIPILYVICVSLFFTTNVLSVRSQDMKFQNFNHVSRSIEKIVSDGEDIWVLKFGELYKRNIYGTILAKYYQELYGVPRPMDSTILFIFIDLYNNIWLGTCEGVFMFDGSAWVKYDESVGLADNFVRTIVQDKDGNMWFGTNHGLSKYDGTNWETYTVTDGLLANVILCLYADIDNNIYAGTWDGVSVFDGETFSTFSEVFGFEDIVEDKDTNLWFATGEGLMKYDGDTWTTYTEADGLLSNHVNELVADSLNRIWAATNEGISVFDGSTWTSYTEADGLTSVFVNTITIDKNGDIWCGTSGGGELKFDGTEWITFPVEEIPQFPQSMDIDSEGNIWISDWFSLVKFDGIQWVSYKAFDDFYIRKQYNTITIDTNDNVWVVSENFDGVSGVSMFDGSNWTLYDNDDGLPVFMYCIGADSKNNIYVGCDDGILAKFDGSSWTQIQSPTTTDRLWSMTIDDNDVIYLGSGSGIYIYDGSSWQNYTTAEGLIDNFVYSVDLDKDDNIWIGTSGGVSKFDGINWTNYTSENGLISNSVNAISVDKTNKVWVGTVLGISIMSNGTWSSYTIAEGLSSNHIYSFAVDAMNITWIGLDGGVACASEDYVALAFRKENYPKGGGIIHPYKSATIIGKEEKTVEFPLVVWSFNLVKSFQLSIHFDPEVIRFEEVSGMYFNGLSGIDFDITDADNGTITVACENTNVVFQSIVDDSSVLSLKFTIVGDDGDSSAIYIDNDPLPIQIIDHNGYEMTFKTTVTHFKVVDGDIEVDVPLQEIDNRQLIYPNPAHDKLIVVGTYQWEEISIMDISGRTVDKYYNLSNNFELTIEDLKPGIYILTGITNDRKVLSQKFVKY